MTQNYQCIDTIVYNDVAWGLISRTDCMIDDFYNKIILLHRLEYDLENPGTPTNIWGVLEQAFGTGDTINSEEFNELDELDAISYYSSRVSLFLEIQRKQLSNTPDIFFDNSKS